MDLRIEKFPLKAGQIDCRSTFCTCRRISSVDERGKKKKKSGRPIPAPFPPSEVYENLKMSFFWGGVFYSVL